MEQLLNWDKEILIYLNNLGSKNFDAFWLWITNQSHWIFLYVFVAGLYMYFLGLKKGLKTLVLIAILLGLCNETTDFFKAYFHRLRPSSNPDLVDSIRDLMHPRNGSFISGHASNSTLFVWFSIFVLKKYSKYIYLLLIWWLLFMYSRIYVGVHYPADILFGIFWGLSIFVLARYIYQKFVVLNS
jgi:undecaprenyl-diphosphatase